jgi:hypothetical protein
MAGNCHTKAGSPGSYQPTKNRCQPKRMEAKIKADSEKFEVFQENM